MYNEILITIIKRHGIQYGDLIFRPCVGLIYAPIYNLCSDLCISAPIMNDFCVLVRRKNKFPSRKGKQACIFFTLSCQLKKKRR